MASSVYRRFRVDHPQCKFFMLGCPAASSAILQPVSPHNYTYTGFDKRKNKRYVRLTEGSIMFSALEAIRYQRGHLSIIDQLQLPHVTVFIPIRSAEDGWHAIRQMRVRGAPAIAIVAALSLAVEILDLVMLGKISKEGEDVISYIEEKLEYLVTSRPTAVNLSDCARKIKSLLRRLPPGSGETVATTFIEYAEKMLIDDVADNRSIGEHGAKWICDNTPPELENQNLGVITHCNTG